MIAAGAPVLNPFSSRALDTFVHEVATHLTAVGIAAAGVLTDCRSAAEIFRHYHYRGLAVVAARLAASGLAAAWNDVLDRQRAPALAHLLAPYLRGTTLDLLCGSGAVGRCLAAEHGVPVTLAERHADYRYTASQREAIAEFSAMSSLPDGSFDTVLLSTVLHHEARPTQMLSLACRLARRRVVIVENPLTARHGEDFHQLMDLFFNCCLNSTGLPSPARHRTRRGWQRAASPFGRGTSMPVDALIPGIPLPHALIMVVPNSATGSQA